MKRLKKGQGVAWLVVLLACIVGMEYCDSDRFRQR